MGAQKWPDDLTPFFKNADVVVLPDNDEPGAKHAALVLAKLQGIAKRVRVIELQDLPPKGDAVDWVEAGGTAEKLHDLVSADLPISEGKVLRPVAASESPRWLQDD